MPATTLTGVAVASGLVLTAGLAAFAVYRPRVRRQLDEAVVVHDEAGAIRAARVHVRDLTGTDVADWPVFAVPVSDPALLQQAHQLDVVDAVVPLLLRWGLLYGWRVRFCGRQDTIVVGVGGTGAVNFLRVTGRRRNTVTALGRPTPPARLPAPVRPDGAASLASEGDVPGGGPRAATEVATRATASPASAVFVDEEAGRSVAVTVEAWDGRVVEVTTRASLNGDGLGAVLQADQRVRGLQRAAMAGMALTLLAGGLALLMARQAPPLGWALALGLVAFTSVMVGEPQMFARMVVYEFDGREPLAGCRRRHVRQTAVAALVNGAFVAAGVAVGETLLSMAGAPPPPPMPAPLVVGAVVACSWLGLTAAAYVHLGARGLLAATAELAPAALRRLGYSWKEVIGASLQSSLGEEVLYRLVPVALAWHLLDQPLLGVVAGAALWSATHDVGDVRPRRARSLELFVLGCALGVVLVVAGLAAAIVAHLLFNLLLLGWPLLPTASRQVEGPWR